MSLERHCRETLKGFEAEQETLPSLRRKIYQIDVSVMRRDDEYRKLTKSRKGLNDEIKVLERELKKSKGKTTHEQACMEVIEAQTKYAGLNRSIEKINQALDALSTEMDKMRVERADLERKEREIASGMKKVDYLLSVGDVVKKYNMPKSDNNNSNYIPTREPPRVGPMDRFVKRIKTSGSGSMFSDYKDVIDHRNVSELTRPGECCKCGADMILNEKESIYSCPGRDGKECGHTQEYIGNGLNSLPYGHMVDYLSESGYKRINHFNEFMAQKRGEGSTVPKEIIDDVKEEYAKNRKTKKDVNDKLTLAYLKKNNHQKYYEHATQVTCRIKEEPAEWLEPMQEDVIRVMFRACQTPWDNCPPHIKKGRKVAIPLRISLILGKKNFPNYSDFVKRCCILRGFDEVVPKLKTLKNPAKLEQHNVIWMYFCECNSWDGRCAILSPYTT